MPLTMRFYRDRPGDLATEAGEPIRGEIPPARSVLLHMLVNRHMLQDDYKLKPMRADVVAEDGAVLVEAAVEVWEPAK